MLLAMFFNPLIPRLAAFLNAAASCFAWKEIFSIKSLAERSKSSPRGLVAPLRISELPNPLSPAYRFASHPKPSSLLFVLLPLPPPLPNASEEMDLAPANRSVAL
jgi:hypothetical protein